MLGHNVQDCIYPDSLDRSTALLLSALEENPDVNRLGQYHPADRISARLEIRGLKNPRYTPGHLASRDIRLISGKPTKSLYYRRIQIGHG